MTLTFLSLSFYLIGLLWGFIEIISVKHVAYHMVTSKPLPSNSHHYYQGCWCCCYFPPSTSQAENEESKFGMEKHLRLRVCITLIYTLLYENRKLSHKRALYFFVLSSKSPLNYKSLISYFQVRKIKVSGIVVLSDHITGKSHRQDSNICFQLQILFPLNYTTL